jgi:hypothetical protein
MVHRHLEFLAGLPQRLIGGVVELGDTETGRCTR